MDSPGVCFKWGMLVRQSLRKMKKAEIWEKIIPSRENSKSKGPETAVCCPACKAVRILM
jgi:uncharacterized paraquat-inducible protein A